MISEKYEMRDDDGADADRVGIARRRSRGWSRDTRRSSRRSVAPPKLPARMPMTVTPICMVERKRPGSCFSSRAMRAPSRPLLGGLLQPHAAGRDERHLGHREDRVQQDEQDDDRELQRQHRASWVRGPGLSLQRKDCRRAGAPNETSPRSGARRVATDAADQRE